MVMAGRKDHISQETRRRDYKRTGRMPMNAPMNTDTHIGEDVQKVPTLDPDRPDIANVATATENLAIVPEAVSPKIEGVTAVETDAQDLLTTATSGD